MTYYGLQRSLGSWFSWLKQGISVHTNERDRFDRFTRRARKVLSLAQEEAQRLRHTAIGAEHLWLALIREREGIASTVLLGLGIDLEKARKAVEERLGRGSSVVIGEIGLTQQAKQVIELSVEEARHLNHAYIGTEHLLLGLLREEEGRESGMSESLGLSSQKVRAEVLQIVSK